MVKHKTFGTLGEDSSRMRKDECSSGMTDKKLKSDDTLVCKTASPPVGKVQFGDFLRTEPIGTSWGYDRGQPIDRLYIESFLEQHRGDVQGRVLEAGDNSYTMRFGGAQVTKSDVLHIDAGIPGATIIADLGAANQIESELFDCIILTQTLQYVFGLSAAVRTLRRILKPGGVLLLTAPGIAQFDQDRWKDLRVWSFTVAGLRRLLLDQFPAATVDVQSRGNVLAVTAFLQGLAQEDIPSLDDLLIGDPHYPLTVLSRPVTPATEHINSIL